MGHEIQAVAADGGVFAGYVTLPSRDRARGLIVLPGVFSTNAWIQTGLPLETGMTRMIDQADDVFLSPRERGQNREDAMREYLTWEINLVKDMAMDDDHRFRVIVG